MNTGQRASAQRGQHLAVLAVNEVGCHRISLRRNPPGTEDCDQQLRYPGNVGEYGRPAMTSPPAPPARADAEMALAFTREELNRALAHKIGYDAEDHNICLAIVKFADGSSAVLAAYSNDAEIPESIRFGLNLVPNV